MSAKPQQRLSPANPVAWGLRDEIAMRALAAMLIRGGFGVTDAAGKFHLYKNPDEHARGAYQFADSMLEARDAA